MQNTHMCWTVHYARRSVTRPEHALRAVGLDLIRVRMRRMTTTVPKGSAVEELYATATKFRNVPTCNTPYRCEVFS